MQMLIHNIYVHLFIYDCRIVGRSENPGVPVAIRWVQSVPLVEIGLTDLPKAGCAMAHPAHPGTTGLFILSIRIFVENV